jgi:Ca2+-binding RTX toxin-like protein
MVIRGFKPGGALAVALISLLGLLPAVASAATRGADLRVVNTAGRTLVEHRQYTGTVVIRTDPQADCFGAPGGSGDRVTVPGPTGLGIVRDALETDADLRPLSVTDQFSFGLAICGIGGFEASGSSFWYLKHNHAGAQVGGDQLRLRNGDQVLWYLSPGFPAPVELALRAPARAKPGVPFQVSVFEFDDSGTRSPAAGATVSGGATPVTTGPRGKATITLNRRGALRATRSSDGSIPSNRVAVCVNADLAKCPGAHGKLIVGSNRADEIYGPPGWDGISARAGDDVVNIRAGGRDRVRCGVGRDRVIVAPGDRDDVIAESCERIVRR